MYTNTCNKQYFPEFRSSSFREVAYCLLLVVVFVVFLFHFLFVDVGVGVGVLKCLAKLLAFTVEFSLIGHVFLNTNRKNIDVFISTEKKNNKKKYRMLIAGLGK